MRANSAGHAPAIPNSTARPADKGASQGIGPASERRTISALVALSASVGTPLRRSEARQIVHSRLSAGQTLAELEAYMRATFRQDPVGVTAARNVDRANPSGTHATGVGRRSDANDRVPPADQGHSMSSPTTTLAILSAAAERCTRRREVA